MKNSRKSHYTDVVRTFKSNEQTVCHLLMNFIYVSYLLSVPPVPTTNQKWGGTCPSVPHGVGAYGGVIISLSRPWARRLINHWSLWRMASATPDLYGYLPSRRASPPLDRYHIILLGDSSTCVNNLPKVVTWKQNGRGSNRRLFWVASPMSTFV